MSKLDFTGLGGEHQKEIARKMATTAADVELENELFNLDNELPEEIKQPEEMNTSSY